MRGNAVDLAVGIIIGAAFTDVVNSLVKDILTPFLGLLFGGIDFSNLFITLKGPHATTLADAQKSGAVTLNIGLFLNAVIPVPNRQFCHILADQGAHADARSTRSSPCGPAKKRGAARGDTRSSRRKAGLTNAPG
jgi:hypothetical protein